MKRSKGQMALEQARLTSSSSAVAGGIWSSNSNIDNSLSYSNSNSDLSISPYTSTHHQSDDSLVKKSRYDNYYSEHDNALAPPATDPSTILSNIKNRLENNFRNLDIILATSLSKKIKTNWSHVKASMEQLTRRKFELIDLANILFVFPDAYKLKWELITDDFSRRMIFELVVYIVRIENSDGLLLSDGNNSSSNYNHNYVSNSNSTSSIIFSSRVENFQHKLQLLENLDEISQSVAVMEKVIPQEPKSISNYFPGRGNANDLCLLVKESILSKKLQSESEINSFRSQGMDGLRKLAEQREIQNKDKKKESKDKEEHMENRKRLESLIRICDIIRSTCNISKRYSFEAEFLATAVSKQIGVTKNEAFSRIKMLCDIIPDYLTIINSDDILSCKAIHINTFCDYHGVRSSLLSRIQESAL